ncbi:SIS domain-containing protein [Fodinicola feengrottensis]|uniref:SIS domain-containing protein n=1 Tax=Fodinicola feengrottensis TaxID=435914 RepID=UPI0024416789|nr:SIS domain-containing protein [Fodinicola feengrottensis]
MTYPTVRWTAAAEQARAVVDRIIETQGGPVTEAAELIAAAIADGAVVQAFGTGHSRSLAQEFTGRAGGLLPVNMLAVKDLVLFGDTDPKEILDPLCERDPGLAERILRLAEVDPRDVFVIASQSGGKRRHRGNGPVGPRPRSQDRRDHVVGAQSADHFAASKRVAALRGRRCGY